jgi:pimeloyl-ACP methyl ester carboxylesterase
MSDSKLVVHFAHANGFPSGSYRQLFSYLHDSVDVFALDKFSHNPKYPIDDNWHNPVAELIDYVESASKGPVVAIGHSFGGVISYIACCKRPDLFCGLIMLDPPLITGLARHVFRFAKKNTLINKVTPAKKTSIRKERWHKDEDLVAYFSARALFKNMDKRCIEDYIDSVTHLKENERRLIFQRDIVANIFRTIPHNLPDYYGQLECPASLITARYTDVCVPRLRNRFLKANPTIQHKEVGQGAHMFPLEHPKLVAHTINDTLKEWGMIL